MYAMITRLTDIKFYLIHAGSNTKRIFKSLSNEGGGNDSPGDRRCNYGKVKPEPKLRDPQDGRTSLCLHSMTQLRVLLLLPYRL